MKISERLTICGYYAGTTRQSLYAVDKDDSTTADSLMNKVADGGKVNEHIRRIVIFDRYTIGVESRGRMMCRNRVGASRDYVSYATI